MANNKVAPVFYSKQSSQHLPMEDGMLIDSKFIESGALISSDAGNLITEGSDGGIRLTASDLICDAGNCDNLLQTCDDGKIFVERPNIVSKQKGNLIVEDRADGSAMLGFSDAVSEDKGNLMSKGSDDKMAVMGKNLVSTDKANLIKVTDGGRLEFTVDDMLSDVACNVIDIDKDGKVKLCLGMDYDLISGKMNLTGNDGAIIDSITIPSAASILESVELVKDPANVGSGYFLKLVFLVSAERKQVIYADMNSLSDIYKAGKGIELTNGYTINVKLASNSGLEFDANGGLKVSSDVVRRPELDQYAKKSDIPDIPAVPVLTGGDGIFYTTSTKGGVTTGTIAVDLATPASGGTVLGISSSGKLSAFAQLAASKNTSTKRDCVVIADRNGNPLAESSHLDFGSGLKLAAFSDAKDHGGLLSADLHLEAVKSGTSKLLRVVDGDGNLLGTNSVSLGAGLDVEDDGKSGRIVATATAYTLESHASSTDKYGAGTGGMYGHVKLTDNASKQGADGTAAIVDGFAVTPKALEGILNRIKALEDAPAASGGFEWPIVKNWSADTNHPYARLFTPVSSPYYAVFSGDVYIGTYAKNTAIDGEYVMCSYVITQGVTDTWAKAKKYFYDIIRTNWVDVPAPELFRYRFTQSENNVLQLDEGFFINNSTNWVGGNEYTGEWQPTSLFGVRCYPLSAPIQLGMKNTNTEAEGLWKSRHAHEAYTVKTV